MTEKDEEHNENKHHPADENIRDRFDGGMDQGRPIIEGLDLDARPATSTR